MPIELAVIAAIGLFLLGISLAIYTGQMTRSAAFFVAISLLVILWITAAAITRKPVVDVTYHPIVQQKLESGKTLNFIEVNDHIVKLSDPVPNDGNAYQVARTRYSGFAWGLRFSESSRYHIIPLK